MTVVLSRDSSEADILQAYNEGAHPALIAESTQRSEENVLTLLAENEGKLPVVDAAPVAAPVVEAPVAAPVEEAPAAEPEVPEETEAPEAE
jgi:hypothetical protein